LEKISFFGNALFFLEKLHIFAETSFLGKASVYEITSIFGIRKNFNFRISELHFSDFGKPHFSDFGKT
jgi:hypothetical protein